MLHAAFCASSRPGLDTATCPHHNAVRVADVNLSFRSMIAESVPTKGLTHLAFKNMLRIIGAADIAVRKVSQTVNDAKEGLCDVPSRPEQGTIHGCPEVLTWDSSEKAHPPKLVHYP